MFDVVPKFDQHKELASHIEEIEATYIKGGEILKDNNGRQALKRKIPQYYDKQQQLELVLAAQELLEFDERDLVHTNSNEEEKCWMDIRDSDI
jgi:hypothetical protein